MSPSSRGPSPTRGWRGPGVDGTTRRGRSPVHQIRRRSADEEGDAARTHPITDLAVAPLARSTRPLRPRPRRRSVPAVPGALPARAPRGARRAGRGPPAGRDRRRRLDPAVADVARVGRRAVRRPRPLPPPAGRDDRRRRARPRRRAGGAPPHPLPPRRAGAGGDPRDHLRRVVDPRRTRPHPRLERRGRAPPPPRGGRAGALAPPPAGRGWSGGLEIRVGSPADRGGGPEGPQRRGGTWLRPARTDRVRPAGAAWRWERSPWRCSRARAPTGPTSSRTAPGRSRPWRSPPSATTPSP